jgi:hypothetical protein
MAMYVFDKNTKAEHYQDVNGTEHKFKAGEYTVKVQFASSNLEMLKTLESTCLIAEFKVDDIPLAFYHKSADIGLSTGKVTNFYTNKGQRLTFWCGEIAKMPKIAKTGDLLVGSVNVYGNGSVNDLYTAYYIVAPESKAKEIDLSVKEPEKEDLVKYAESVRDLKISWIGKVKTVENKVSLIKDLQTTYPDSYELTKQTLLVYDEIKSDDIEVESKCTDRISFCKTVIQKIDNGKVAIYFGQNQRTEDEKEKLLKTEMELQKEILALSYRLMSKIYSILKTLNSNVFSDLDLVKRGDDMLLEYKKWTSVDEIEDGSYLILYSEQQKRLGFPATALEKVQKYVVNPKNVEKKEYKRLVEIKMELIEALGWDLWKQYEEEWKVINFPVLQSHF